MAPIRRTFIEFVGTKGIVSAYDFTHNNATVSLQITTAKDETTKIEQIVIPNLYVEEISLFSDSIIRNTDPFVPGSVGLKNQIVLDAAMKTGN